VPGIPLKIVLEPVSFTLLEARAKRVSFLSTVVRELALRQCKIVNDRVERIADDRAASFDAVVMRCAGDPAQLADAALRVLKPAGIIVATGPPSRRPTPIGKWSEVDGPLGRRLFWVLRKS
jgi:16S rRNA (guanine527-N7)-methyltransferase